MQKLIALMVLIVLSSCASPALPPTETPTIQPTFTATTTSTKTPEPTLTLTPQPTETIAPTEVPLPMITFENAKTGEKITMPEFQDFESSMQYVAENTLWYSGENDRNTISHDFALNNPDLENFLKQFDGISGRTRKGWDASTNPKYYNTATDSFFPLYIGTLGNGTLIVFQKEDGSFEASYANVKVRDYLNLEDKSPVMLTLHPKE